MSDPSTPINQPSTTLPTSFRMSDDTCLDCIGTTDSSSYCNIWKSTSQPTVNKELASRSKACRYFKPHTCPTCGSDYLHSEYPRTDSFHHTDAAYSVKDTKAEKRSGAGRCVARDLKLRPSSKRWSDMECRENDGDCCLRCWEKHLEKARAAYCGAAEKAVEGESHD
jgi:hypothetical protein